MLFVTHPAEVEAVRTGLVPLTWLAGCTRISSSGLARRKDVVGTLLIC